MLRTVVSVNGRIDPPEKACVPALDRGFLYGDSVYEVLWWHRGVPVQAREHMDRLRESARRVYMSIDASDEALLAALHDAVAATGCGPTDDAYLRLVVTRGEGPLGLHVVEGLRQNVVIVAGPANRPSPAVRERGFVVALVDRLRISAKALDPGAKTGNYLNNLLALHEAEARGADDAVLLNDRGEVTEGTTSNVYVVAGGAVSTPPIEAGILKGTTRNRVLAICGERRIPAHERPLRTTDLLAADEVFLSSSVRGIIGVARIDGSPVGEGRPGPVTRSIHGWFEAAADAEAFSRSARKCP